MTGIMGNALLSDRNHVLGLTPSGGAWEAEAPAAEMGRLPLGIAAVSADDDPASTVAEWAFAGRVIVDVAGLLATNLPQTARYRWTFWLDVPGGVLLHDCGWRRMVPRLNGWRSLRYGATNFFAGGLRQEDAAIYPANAFVTVPAVRAGAARLEVDAAGLVAEGRVRVGLAWVGEAVPLARNHSYGLSTEYEPGDEVMRYPGGSFVDPAPGVRRVEIPWKAMRPDQAAALMDMSRRVGYWHPLLYLPDPDDAARCYREGFVGQRRQPTRAELIAHRTLTATIDLEEVTR